ncbi:hypothetical protein [Photorhabdus tasmaniensis]|uniref:hypothetical protein n=1 Tax=Photorhabdus tasmaniensis TaxID=1004159 RepID=UPI003BB6DC74
MHYSQSEKKKEQLLRETLLESIYQLHRQQGKLALCTMCIGVGQGIAMILEKV